MFMTKSRLKTLEIIVIGIPHSIIWYIWTYNMSNLMSWQVIYFFLICYYMKYKICSVNNNLVINLKSSKIYQINHSIDLIKSLNSLYLEINDYNSNYWSKFLLLIWLTYSAISDSLLYSTIFGKMNLLSRILFIYAAISMSSSLLLIISIASSVNSEANKSYQLLNSLMITSSRNCSYRTLHENKIRLKV